MVCFLQNSLESQGKKLADLEDYIDTMVLRVMESAPVILENNLHLQYHLKYRRWIQKNLILISSLDIDWYIHNHLNYVIPSEYHELLMLKY